MYGHVTLLTTYRHYPTDPSRWGIPASSKWQDIPMSFSLLLSFMGKIQVRALWPVLQTLIWRKEMPKKTKDKKKKNDLGEKIAENIRKARARKKKKKY